VSGPLGTGLLLAAGLSLWPTDLRDKESLRFTSISEQAWDESCGMASLDSLLRFYRGISIPSELIDSHSDELSLRTLLELTSSTGLDCGAFRMDYAQLCETLWHYAPVLVHYDKPDAHFALVLAADSDSVVCADPARGTECLSVPDFLERWSGATLVVDYGPDRESGESLVEFTVDLARKRFDLLKRSTVPARRSFLE
jgi:ABC-type bacteriocin/lantibiotic exporter with double-glycine peptidase domain